MTTVLEKPAARVPITGKTAIYTRVSTDRQREEGASLHVQLEACQRYCAEHGLIAISEFRDVQSGLEVARPQYMQAVDLARAKGIDKLVVWRLDRLGRDSAEYIPLLKGLKRLGVDVVSVTQATESLFMQQVLGIMSEEESRQLSIRVTASKQRRFKEGKWGTMPPFGYSTEKHPEGGSVLIPNAEAPLVSEMFERYASGKHTLIDLRDYLNENGHLKSRHAIGYMLKNPVYVGMVRQGAYVKSQFHPKPDLSQAEGKHQPIVDQETFDKVQERLAANAHRQRGGARPKYLFSGLIYCGGCGHKFVGRTVKSRGRDWPLYQCNRKEEFGDCFSHSISESRVRAKVIPPIQALLKQLSHEDHRVAVREELLQQQEAATQGALQTKETLAESQRRLEGRLSRLEDSYLDGDLDRDRYLIRRDEIKAQLEDVKAALAANNRLDTPDLEELFRMADALEGEPPDDTEWRDLIEGMVERIVVEGSGKKGERSTAKVVWKSEFAPLFEAVT